MPEPLCTASRSWNEPAVNALLDVSELGVPALYANSLAPVLVGSVIAKSLLLLLPKSNNVASEGILVIGFTTQKTVAPLVKLAKPDGNCMNSDDPSKATAGRELTALLTRVGWSDPFDWLASMALPLMSNHELMLEPLAIWALLSALSQSWRFVFGTALVAESI